MSDYEWETIDVPSGAFIGWGTREGQHVTGKVLEYLPAGGTDFDGNPCPRLAVELIERAASFNKAGERTDYDPKEIVSLNVGQTGLKAAVLRANPEAGDLIKITMTGTTRTNKGNDIKGFDLKIARGAGNPQAARRAVAEAEPPF